MNSPALSFSGTGSAPRRSTQQGSCRSRIDAARTSADTSAATLASPEPQQRLRDHRAVAYPRPRVRARSRTQHRAIARHQDMRERRIAACRPAAARSAGTRSETRLSFCAPRGRGGAPLGATQACVDMRRRSGRAAPSRQGDDQRRASGCRAAGARACRPSRARRVTERVMRSSASAQRRSRQQPGQSGRGRRERADPVGALQRVHLAFVVDGERRSVPGDVANRADSADGIEELRRRVDLKRAHGEHELQRQSIAGQVRELVAGDEARCAARRRRERRYAELPLRAAASARRASADSRRRRNGCVSTSAQVVSLPPATTNGSIEKPPCPTSSAPSTDKQPVVAAAVDADQRPVRLLAGKPARIVPARRIACEHFDEGIGRFAEIRVLDLDFGEAVAARARRAARAAGSGFRLRAAPARRCRRCPR